MNDLHNKDRRTRYARQAWIEAPFIYTIRIWMMCWTIYSRSWYLKLHVHWIIFSVSAGRILPILFVRKSTVMIIIKYCFCMTLQQKYRFIYCQTVAKRTMLTTVCLTAFWPFRKQRLFLHFKWIVVWPSTGCCCAVNVSTGKSSRELLTNFIRTGLEISHAGSNGKWRGELSVWLRSSISK